MHEVKNILDDRDCNYLINYFENIAKNRVEDIEVHRDTFIFKILQHPHIDYWIHEILTKTFNTVCEYYDVKNLHNSEIVFWDKGSKMAKHSDPKWIKCISVVYLNDDFVGGETFYCPNGDNQINIIPDKGKMIIFEGHNVYHGVNEVLSNCRYALTTSYI